MATMIERIAAAEERAAAIKKQAAADARARIDGGQGHRGRTRRAARKAGGSGKAGRSRRAEAF